ncbi:MAG: CHAT domain-containing protein, partial [Bacteroidota bacterium]
MQKNTVTDSVLIAQGNIHIGDIIYQATEDFFHSILFLRLEPQANNSYTAQLTLKSHQSGKGKLPKEGISLFREAISLPLSEKLFTQVTAFQQVRRLNEASFRNLAYLTPESLRADENALSRALYEAIFVDDVRTVCEQFVGLLNNQKIEELLLVVSTEDTRVMNLPFEITLPHFFPEQKNALGKDRFGIMRTQMSNLDAFDMQGKSATAAPLKMLFVTALPENMNERSKMLEIERERKELIEAVKMLGDSTQPKLVIQFLDIASLEEINQAIQKGQHDILHISGHGSYDKAGKKGVLHLEDEEGNHREASGQELAATLRCHSCLKL